MEKHELKRVKKYLLELADEIMTAKQPEYTNKNIDVLNNFKTSAKLVGITPEEIWAAHFIKHVQSILSHAHNPGMEKAEPIQTRYADAINYLFLGFCLVVENEIDNDIISGTE
tara:strand:- start:3256 stop:3594 length:339 start_codon:yes stop_codon:yes gene_type:complete